MGFGYDEVSREEVPVLGSHPATDCKGNVVVSVTWGHEGEEGRRVHEDPVPRPLPKCHGALAP